MTEIIRADLHNRQHGEALVSLLDEYARDEMGGGSPLADEVKANLAEALAARPGAHVLLAWVDGEPVGVATCFEGFPPSPAAPCSTFTTLPCTRPIAVGVWARRCSPRRIASPGSWVAAS